ncbi:MAG TPA: hypothetical protein VFF65_11345, partial [Phycisphaerales bacterium]|nr:hypothetical protein [Phycisphaerales bacterium]
MNAPTCPLCQGAMVRDHHGVGFIGAGFAWLVLALGLLMSICLFPIGALAGIVGLLVAMLIFQTRRDVLTCDGCGYTVDRIGGGRRTGPMGGRSLSERLITEPQAPAAPDFTRKQIVCGVIIFVCFIGALGGVSVFQRQREQAAAAAGEPPAQARGDPKAPPGTPGYAYRNLDAVVYAFLEATGENKPAKPSRLQIPVSELRAWQAALGRWMTSSDAVRMRNGELHIGDPW